MFIKEKTLALVVLAAGIGSRFGGIKQLSSVGPNGETIIDYSLYDAYQAGFKKIVFVIRREIEADFHKLIGQFWERMAEVRYVFQELTSLLPSDFSLPHNRAKPWGTGHALLVAQEQISGPFAVINADDFYGRQAFKIMAEYLSSISLRPVNGKPNYSLVGYRLKQTLSDFGPVCRGLCYLEGGEIIDIKEMKHLEKSEKGAKARLENGGWLELSGEEVVSMNFWGFEPSIFDLLKTGFLEFLAKKGQDSQSEFLIPDFIGQLLRKGKIRVHYLPTEEKWFGVTYPEDLPLVRQGIASLLAKGEYPENLKRSLESQGLS
ncbi:MAG: NTP transferase domain-containing protein [Candidatus Aminicenantes bacterium]|nr:NTP transferase domain-containing protein [Candidatus Aminicenantes bacterium]